MLQNHWRLGAIVAFVPGVLIALSPSIRADITEATAEQSQNHVLDTYERLLPLEGGSNFRDLGGYETIDGKTVRKGLLFRSGVMTSLTGKDVEYLAGIDFDTVVDLRSRDELDLFPNHWAKQSGIEYVSHDYTFEQMMASLPEATVRKSDPGAVYRAFPYILKPQLKMYFDEAINGHAPLVVNCSGGQDRTGVASALMLSALGVPREYIVQDYVLTAEYRRPDVERGDIDVAAAANSNAFAKYMQEHPPKKSNTGAPSKAAPLFTPEGIPFIYYTFQQIEADHGSVLVYLDKELGVDADDIARLKAQYLE